jgi:hypothetical protein
MDKNEVASRPLFRRKRRPRSAWMREVKAFRESGLTVEEYGAKRGIHVATMMRWMRVLRGEASVSTGVGKAAFVPVTVVHPDRFSDSESALMVEVELGNGRRLRVRVRSEADLKRLADVVDGLEGGVRC